MKTKIKSQSKKKIQKREWQKKQLVDVSTLTGVWNRLTVLPVTEFGFELSKQPLWDSIRLRHG